MTAGGRTLGLACEALLLARGLWLEGIARRGGLEGACGNEGDQGDQDEAFHVIGERRTWAMDLALFVDFRLAWYRLRVENAHVEAMSWALLGFLLLCLAGALATAKHWAKRDDAMQQCLERGETHAECNARGREHYR